VVMEWIEGIRCTDIAGVISSGVDVDEFIRCGCRMPCASVYVCICMPE
jgi:predicted unusual protein kinase regulating ubiquinone biosynthesis (AarF/ABC1/UbiB family)